MLWRRIFLPERFEVPIYEYACEACGHALEKLQKLSDAPLTDCPHCGEPSLQKQISAAGFRLKGGGWYETDFKSGNKKNLSGDGNKASAEKKSDSGKSDKPAKPAASSSNKD